MLSAKDITAMQRLITWMKKEATAPGSADGDAIIDVDPGEVTEIQPEFDTRPNGRY